MRNVPGDQAAANIGGTAMWNGHECLNVKYPWPHMFGLLGDEYDRRYGIKREHLARIAEVNFANAKRNPNAQTRKWTFTPESFSDDDQANPVIDGRIRKQDCGQVSDGAAVVFLASASRAARYAREHGLSLDDLPRLRGWGHRTAPISYDAKIRESRDAEYIFPHVRGTITDAFRRAGLQSVDDIDVIETHDCFTTTEYMAIDHFGITAPGESWKAIENGDIEMGGRIPVNPSGGPDRAWPSCWRHGRAHVVRCLQAVCRRSGQLPGARRQERRNPERRWQRHDHREFHRLERNLISPA